MANPARGLLNREKKKKKKSGSAPPPPPPRALLVWRKNVEKGWGDKAGKEEARSRDKMKKVGVYVFRLARDYASAKERFKCLGNPVFWGVSEESISCSVFNILVLGDRGTPPAFAVFCHLLFFVECDNQQSICWRPSTASFHTTTIVCSFPVLHLREVAYSMNELFCKTSFWRSFV